MVVDWPSRVNQEISFDGDHGHTGGFIETVEFDSGNKGTRLKNSQIPAEYPSLSLILNNIGSGKTEYDAFVEWFNDSLKYGILPFYFPRIGYIKEWYIRTGEIGIYQFLPNSLRFDRVDGIIMATFGMKEKGFLSEIEYTFLTTNDGEILLTGNGKCIAID